MWHQRKGRIGSGRHSGGREWTGRAASRRKPLPGHVTTSFKIKRPPVALDEVEPCGSPPKIGDNEELVAAYNPFIEGVTDSGRISSCIDCHSRAVADWSAERGSMIEECPHGDDRPKLEDFEGKIRTDYLWSVA